MSTYHPKTARGLYWPAFLIAALLIVLGVVVNPRFLSIFNLSNLVVQTAALLIVAIGQTMVIIHGGLDLSVGSTVSLSTAIVATVTAATGSIFFAIVVAFGAGVLVALFNGYGVTKLSINPLMMTLATMSIVQGITLFVLPIPGGLLSKKFAGVFTGNIFGVPNALLICSLLVGLGSWILNQTRFGRELYAVGNNRENAFACGIKTNRVTLTTFVLSSSAAVIAGLFLAARMRSGDPLVGQTFSLDSVTAAVLGGSVIGGGIGGIRGTIPGALILVVIGNILNFAGVPSFFQYVVRGLLLIFTVGLFGLIAKKKRLSNV